MDTLFIPTEADFKRWIREAIKEELEPLLGSIKTSSNIENEPLLTRKEIAKYLRISLVTLTDWVKRGLPSHRKRGRVLFLRTEVLQWVKETMEE